MRSGRLRGETGWALGLGLALGLYWFGSAAAGAGMLFTRDIDIFWYGHVEALLRAVAAGELPLWNPYRHFGQPVAPYAVGQLFYPTTLPQILLPPALAYGWFALLHFVATFCGAWALARRLDLAPVPAAATATAWACSGPLLSTVHMANTWAAATWLPWAFLAALRLRDPDGGPAAAGLGATLALAVLAGSPEVALMGGAGVVASWRAPVGTAVYARRVGVAVLLGLALSCVQWLPTLEHLPRSARQHMPATASVFWSNHPAGLVQLFVPIDLGDLPLEGRARQELFSGRDPFLHSLYLGLGSAGFVALGLLTAPAAGRLAFGLGGAVALAISLGRHSLLYAAVAPLLAPFRFPSKFTLVAALCWAVLAGYGVHALASASRRQRWAAAAVAAGGTVVALLVARPDAAFWGPLASVADLATSDVFRHGVTLTRVAALASAVGAALLMAGGTAAARAAVLVVGVDLCVALAALNPTVPADLYARRPAVTAGVATQRPNRTLVLSYPTPEVALAALDEGSGPPRPFAFPPLAEYAAWRVYPHPMLGSGQWGIEGSPQDIAGLGLLHSRRLDWFVQSAAAWPDFRRLAEVTGTSLVMSLHDRGLEELPVLARLPGPGGDTIRVRAVPGVLPRAYAVSGVRSAPGEGHDTRALLAPDFDPRAEAYIADEAPRPATAGFAAEVDLVRLGFTRVELEARLSHDGFVVLLESHDAHWFATVDGQPVATRRANVAFRAVPVPAGRHRVVMEYRPWPVAAGAAVSLAALVALGLLRVRAAAR